MKKLIFFLSVFFVSLYSFGQTTMQEVKAGSHIMKDDKITIVKSPAAANNRLADFSIEEADEIILSDLGVTLSNVTLKAKKIILVTALLNITIEGQVIFECDELIIGAATGLIIDEKSKGSFTVSYHTSVVGNIKTATTPTQKWSNVTIRFEKTN
jgi:hypothetical protein